MPDRRSTTATLLSIGTFEGQGKSTITKVCKKYNISRQTYYDWKEDIEKSAAEFFDNVQLLVRNTGSPSS